MRRKKTADEMGDWECAWFCVCVRGVFFPLKHVSALPADKQDVVFCLFFQEQIAALKCNPVNSPQFWYGLLNEAFWASLKASWKLWEACWPNDTWPTWEPEQTCWLRNTERFSAATRPPHLLLGRTLCDLIAQDKVHFNALICLFMTWLDHLLRSCLTVSDAVKQPNVTAVSCSLPRSSSFTSLAAFSPSSRRFLSIILDLSAAALSSALTVQPMAPRQRGAPMARWWNSLSTDALSAPAGGSCVRRSPLLGLFHPRAETQARVRRWSGWIIGLMECYRRSLSMRPARLAPASIRALPRIAGLPGNASHDTSRWTRRRLVAMVQLKQVRLSTVACVEPIIVESLPSAFRPRRDPRSAGRRPQWTPEPICEDLSPRDRRRGCKNG